MASGVAAGLRQEAVMVRRSVGWVGNELQQVGEFGLMNVLPRLCEEAMVSQGGNGAR